MLIKVLRYQATPCLSLVSIEASSSTDNAHVSESLVDILASELVYGKATPLISIVKGSGTEQCATYLTSIIQVGIVVGVGVGIGVRVVSHGWGCG